MINGASRDRWHVDWVIGPEGAALQLLQFPGTTVVVESASKSLASRLVWLMNTGKYWQEKANK